MPDRPRVRDLGLVIGDLPTGSTNTITDVPGVRAGHLTVVDEARGWQTGVTAVVPVPWDRLPSPGARAGFVAGNGYGKVVGTTQVEETGRVETPIVLTGTLSTFRVADHLITALLERPGYADRTSINPVVAETNDGMLSDGPARPITLDHVRQVLAEASAGPLAEGCVGAGRGVQALGYKAGVGTASRMIDTPDGPWTVGVLVQANFGGVLRVAGREVGTSLRPRGAGSASDPPAGSCVVVVATDLPADASSLRRVAARGVLAMGRVGAAYASRSGDYGLAFSSAEDPPVDAEVLGRTFDRVLLGTLDATEEALLNSLTAAETITGRDGRTVDAIDVDALRRLVQA